MALNFSGFGLLGFGLVLSVSSLCLAQVESSSALADREYLPCTPRKIQPCRIILPIERPAGFRVILVNVRVNGKPAVLIVDTGSSTTILSPEASGLDPINLERAAPPRKGTGFVEDARWGEATLVTGTKIWKNHRILVADMKSVSTVMCQKIDGILGQDILYAFKYIEIDFEHKRLVLGSD